MKKYCFNYSVEGVKTMLPLFIVFLAENITDKEAFEKALQMAEAKWPNKKITIL